MNIPRSINFSPVRNHLNLRVSMTNRATGHTRSHQPAISELLEQAKTASGAYGSDNTPVGADMLVMDLLDWHGDWTFELAEAESV